MDSHVHIDLNTCPMNVFIYLKYSERNRNNVSTLGTRNHCGIKIKMKIESFIVALA